MTHSPAIAAFEANVAALQGLVADLEGRFYGSDMPAPLQRTFDKACGALDLADDYRVKGVREQDEFGFETLRELH